MISPIVVGCHDHLCPSYVYSKGYHLNLLLELLGFPLPGGNPPPPPSEFTTPTLEVNDGRALYFSVVETLLQCPVSCLKFDSLLQSNSY